MCCETPRWLRLKMWGLFLKTYINSGIVSKALISSSINPFDIASLQVCSGNESVGFVSFLLQPVAQKSIETALYISNLTWVWWSVTGHPWALNRGRAFPVGSGACTKLPITTKSKRVHLSRGGCECQRMLPNNMTWYYLILHCVHPDRTCRNTDSFTFRRQSAWLHFPWAQTLSLDWFHGL